MMIIQGIPYINCTTWSDDYDELELALALNASDQKVSEKKNSRTQRLLSKQAIFKES